MKKIGAVQTRSCRKDQLIQQENRLMNPLCCGFKREPTSSATNFSGSSLRPQIITVAPSFANPNAIPLPIPVPPPVTIVRSPASISNINLIALAVINSKTESTTSTSWQRRFAGCLSNKWMNFTTWLQLGKRHLFVWTISVLPTATTVSRMRCYIYFVHDESTMTVSGSINLHPFYTGDCYPREALIETIQTHYTATDHVFLFCSPRALFLRPQTRSILLL